MRNILLFALLLVTWTACSDGDSTAPDSPSPVASVEVVSGNNQSDTVGQSLDEPLVVVALDAEGTPVSGQVLNFVVKAGGGSVFAGATSTNAEGRAQEIWTLGTNAADSQVVEVRAVDNTTGEPKVYARFEAVAKHDRPNRLSAVSGQDQIGAMLTALLDSLVVEVVDQYGNPTVGDSIVWSTTPEGGAVSPSTAAVSGNGLSAAQWELGEMGTHTATATVANHPELQVTFRADALIAWRVLAPGRTHTCGITVGGQLYCWGGNSFGQLGVGDTGDRAAPTPVQSNLAFDNVVAGSDASCAITAEGSAYCWGRNDWGNLGIGTTSTYPDPGAVIPTAVHGGIAFRQLAASQLVTCGVAVDGAAYCWGANNQGQLGTGDTVSQTVPAPVSIEEPVQHIAPAEGQHTCAINTSGIAYCWGSNGLGQLGIGTLDADAHWLPEAVQGGMVFEHIDGNGAATCALAESAKAYCWGDNQHLALGQDVGEVYYPSPVTTEVDFSRIDVGGYTVCGLSTSGTAYCWGVNGFGTLGSSSSRDTRAQTPRLVAGGHTFVALTHGVGIVCGLTEIGVGYCWGYNGAGGTGTGSPDEYVWVPTPIQNPVQ